MTSQFPLCKALRIKQLMDCLELMTLDWSSEIANCDTQYVITYPIYYFRYTHHSFIFHQAAPAEESNEEVSDESKEKTPSLNPSHIYSYLI
jgi:hypothetical protein